MTPERVIADLRACVSVGSPPDLNTHLHPRSEIAKRIWAAIDLIDRLASDLQTERDAAQELENQLRNGCDSP